MAKRVRPKNIKEIAKEWDAVCKRRHVLINSGKDISLTLVTAPFILEKISRFHSLNVLDVGCGTGYLTNKIAELGNYCTGVDISATSIEIARDCYLNNRTAFVACKIKDAHFEKRFDLCVANMVLMDDPEWDDSIKNIHSLLDDNGLFLFTITHPWFWPKYWRYENEPWFNYNDEIYIENTLSITLQKDLGITTHIHRPLSMYFSVIISLGFSIESIEEIIPKEFMPEGYETSYPKFLFFKCRKQ